MYKKKNRCAIKKISKTEYIRLNVPVFNIDGEIIDYESDGIVYKMNPYEKINGAKERNKRSLQKIYNDALHMIQKNFRNTKGENKLLLELTYDGANKTNDHKKIHNDFRYYWKRLTYKYNDYDLGYIAIVEPNGDGNFHIHMILQSLNGNKLDITPKDIETIWRNGSVKIEEFHRNYIASYFIAHFAGIDILTEEEIKELEQQNDIEEKNGKKYAKGKRLSYYPDGMQIYRYSRNMEKYM